MKYTIFAANTSTGAGISSLSPVWTGSPATIYNFDVASPAITGATLPAITEVGGAGNGGGFYTFDTGVYAGLNLCGTIDLTASGPSGAGRYVRVVISGSNASIQPVLSDRISVSGGGGGSGTVTSVGLSTASFAEVTVGSSPVTTSGTITLTKANQSANQVWAGPASGAAAAPAFRALVSADLPSTTPAVDYYSYTYAGGF